MLSCLVFQENFKQHISDIIDLTAMLNYFVLYDDINNDGTHALKERDWYNFRNICQI